MAKPGSLRDAQALYYETLWRHADTPPAVHLEEGDTWLSQVKPPTQACHVSQVPTHRTGSEKKP